jgi:hypothetical protein
MYDLPLVHIVHVSVMVMLAFVLTSIEMFVFVTHAVLSTAMILPAPMAIIMRITTAWGAVILSGCDSKVSNFN